MTDRCPSCGGLVTPDAAWCGQCYAPLRGPQAAGAEEPVGPPPGEPVEEGRAGPGWDCPVCGRRNPLRADACSACGTPFDRLLRDGAPRPRVDPARARRLSLLFPGAGHLAAGRTADGLARMVAFAWVLGGLLSVLMIRRGQPLGAASMLVAMYALAAVGLYAVTFLDAERAAAGEPPILSSRALLAGVAVAVLLTLALPLILRIG